MDWKILSGAAILGSFIWLAAPAAAAGPSGAGVPNIEGLSPKVDVHKRRFRHSHCYWHRHHKHGRKHRHCNRHGGGGGGGITIIIGL
jgi:hypothetical protein